MENEEVRQIFNDAIKKESDPEQKAKMELVREYFTNPKFKAALEKMVFDINNKK